MMFGFKASCWTAAILASLDWKVNSVAGRPPCPPTNLMVGSQVPNGLAPPAAGAGAAVATGAAAAEVSTTTGAADVTAAASRVTCLCVNYCMKRVE